jgi:hypothetical protein
MDEKFIRSDAFSLLGITVALARIFGGALAFHFLR